MIRRGVTYEDVTQAAEELRSQGEIPTIERIRNILGGTGSNTTISKYLNEWRHYAHGTPLAPAADPVQIAVQRVWQQLQDEKDAEIKKIRDESNELVSAAQASEQIATQKMEAIQSELGTLNNQFLQLQGAKDILALDFKKLQEDYALLQERYKGLDERYTDFQRSTAQQQESLTKAHQNEIDHILEKAQMQNDANLQLISELKNHNEQQRLHYIVENDTLKTNNKKLHNELENYKASLKEKDVEIVKIKTELTATTIERDRLDAQITPQMKVWNALEKNNQLSNLILTELKEVPKLDTTLQCFSEIKDKFLKFYKISVETQAIVYAMDKMIKDSDSANDQ